MKNHTKVYMKHFGYGMDEFIPSEVSGSRATDIHHLVFRSQGGTDVIDNLIELTREEHEQAHKDRSYNEYLKVLHAKKLRVWSDI